MKDKEIAVYWNDLRVYHDGGIHKPTPALTEGLLYRETNKYLLIKDPDTLLIDSIKNHPEKKPTFCYIPKTMITEVIYLNKKSGKN